MSADVLYAMAVALTVLLGLTVNTRKQREADGEPSVDWRCRLGLHRWKPVCRYWPGIPAREVPSLPPAFNGLRIFPSWDSTGRKCCRCGKRK